MEVTIPISDIKIDQSIYPRAYVSDNHIEAMADAVRAGVTLPPILLDRQSMRLVDGYHRYQRAKIAGETEMRAILQDFADEQAVFEAAITANAAHGFNYAPYDRQRIVGIGLKMGLTVDRLAAALSMTVTKVAELQRGVGEKVKNLNGIILPSAKPEKKKLQSRNHRTTVNPLSNVQTHSALPNTAGESQMFYINQLVVVIENKLLDFRQDRLTYMLHKLAKLIDEKVPLHTPKEAWRD
jgi:hypothetical protein